MNPGIARFSAASLPVLDPRLTLAYMVSDIRSFRVLPASSSTELHAKGPY